MKKDGIENTIYGIESTILRTDILLTINYAKVNRELDHYVDIIRANRGIYSKVDGTYKLHPDPVYCIGLQADYQLVIFMEDTSGEDLVDPVFKPVIKTVPAYVITDENTEKILLDDKYWTGILKPSFYKNKEETNDNIDWIQSVNVYNRHPAKREYYITGIRIFAKRKK